MGTPVYTYFTWFVRCYFLVLCVISRTPVPAKIANATTNNTLNFQARLLTASGSVVPAWKLTTLNLNCIVH